LDLNRKPWLHGIEHGIDLDLCRIDKEFTPPHTPRVDALLEDGVEEAAKSLQLVSLTDAHWVVQA
jgi:hypothetical protein